MQPAVYRYFANYGTQTTFGFATQDFTDVDDLYIGTAWAAGDAKISKDWGAVASTTNTPAQITASQPIHTIVLTATEMQAAEIFVTIRDQTESEVFEPVVIHITTQLLLSKILVDATNIGGNVNAIAGTGVGTGSGIIGTGGATGDGLEGIGGATSGFGIKGTATSTNENNNVFTVTEGTEPGSAIGNNATILRIIQGLKRRFYNKVTQTTTQQKVYGDDSTTAVETMTCSNDLTTQTKGKSA